MATEYRDASLRFFWWACGKGHPILEAAYHGERELLAPDDCNDYDPKARH